MTFISGPMKGPIKHHLELLPHSTEKFTIRQVYSF